VECAEETLGQIGHFYGDQSAEVLRRIRLVYISHMNPDRLGGVYGLIRQRRRAFEDRQQPYQKLILLCPNNYVDVGRKQWHYFSHEHVFDGDVHVIFNRTLNNGLPTLTNVAGAWTDEERFLYEHFRSIGLHAVQTVLVEHIDDARALVLRHIDGWSIAFIGDCQQPNDFIQAGKRAFSEKISIYG
jgi:ribonuclease Z